MPARLWDVGRKLHDGLRDFFDTPPDANATPLELLQAALDALEQKTQPSGRGARTFPYTSVVVHVSQPDIDRAAIESVFRQLVPRLRERMAELRCELPATLKASLVVGDAARAGVPVLWIECSGDVAPPPEADSRLDRLELRISPVKGQCEQAEYTLTSRTVTIGRGAEPSDAFGRMRRNDVAFADIRDGVSETVARAHARLEYDPATRAYYLFNEATSNPTFLLRGGRTLRVVPRDPRGVRVQSGDELQLGRAVVRVIVGTTDSERP